MPLTGHKITGTNLVSTVLAAVPPASAVVQVPAALPLVPQRRRGGRA